MKKGATTMNVRNINQGVVSPTYTGPVGNWGFSGVQTGGFVAEGFAPAPGYGWSASPNNFAPTPTTSPIVHPTRQSVSRNVFRHVVPHVHPSHHHTVNEHVYQHQHYVTNTCSTSNRCCSQHVFCGPLPPRPCGWC